MNTYPGQYGTLHLRYRAEITVLNVCELKPLAIRAVWFS